MYDVEEDDTDLVIRSDALVEQNGHDVAHVVFDLLAFRICAHCQVLWRRKQHCIHDFVLMI